MYSCDGKADFSAVSLQNENSVSNYSLKLLNNSLILIYLQGWNNMRVSNY